MITLSLIGRKQEKKMSDNIMNEQAAQDFDKAKSKALFSDVLAVLKPEKKQLLSFYDIKDLVKPKKETYRGMKAVSLSLIVGSEDRYTDFNQAFLPKKEHLRYRWISIDKAYYKDVILPPIKLFKLGEVYFVRDGNHRVSVARIKGVGAIDAEVVELTSEIKLTKDMTQEDLKKKVVDFEKKRILKSTGLGRLLCFHEIYFTAPGRYEELLGHIMGHKYYINMGKEEEITLTEAALSWYDNLYIPICHIINQNNIISRFPERTEADLYIWIVKHWDHLKGKFGQQYPLDKAAQEYSAIYGEGKTIRLIKWLKRLFGKG